MAANWSICTSSDAYLQSKYLDWAEGLEVGGVEVLEVAEDAVGVGAVLDPLLLGCLDVVEGEGLCYFEDLLAAWLGDAEFAVAESRTEIYLSRTKVMEMLEVASATLWRWEKCGYLVPLSVGSKKRYRLSDIQRLLNR